MTAIPLETLACTIDATGISAPVYGDILATLQFQFQSIYGSDVDLDPDTQDGQWLAILAAGFNDSNNACIGIYNQFSPATAQGAGLSSNVKLNGLSRDIPTNSTADLTIMGQAGVAVINGQITDGSNVWALPAEVDIPGGGSVIATATCTTPGAVAAAENTINQIVNPQRGWQSATNASAAPPGQPVETDSALRQRQATSTAIVAMTPLQAITAAVGQVVGVSAIQPYENDTGTTDGNGLPPHSISLVVSGGDAVAVATAINNKKGEGVATYGTTSEIVEDPAGVPKTINFFRPTAKRIVVSLTVTPLTGFVSTTKTAIATALSNAVGALAIGFNGGVAIGDLMAAAKLPGPLGQTYKIESGALEACVFGGSLGTADIALAFNEQAGLAAADITIAP